MPPPLRCLAALALLMLSAAAGRASSDTDAASSAATAAGDDSRQRLEMIKAQPLYGNFVFDTTTFPKIDFFNRELVGAAIGSYSLKTRFFDAQWHEVTTPEKPGRYGARVEFTGDKGLSFTRRITLFKTALPYKPANNPYDVRVTFPASFGFSAAWIAREKWEVSNWSGETFNEASRNGQSWGILLAGLHDAAADPARLRGFSTWQINNDWWSELEQHLGERQDYPYLVHLPDGYDDTTVRWPLLLFLHGSGERGSDLQRLQGQGPIGFVNHGHTLPFIVVEPLCPENEWWSARRLALLLDKIEGEQRVDTRRIYVTGLSMGGFGSLDFAATYPDRVAAIAPLSGGENPELAERLRHMPTWFFHGAEDDVVPVRFSVDLAHAMQKLGAPVRLTVIPHVGHGDWDVTYADPALYAWFLAHSK